VPAVQKEVAVSDPMMQERVIGAILGIGIVGAIGYVVLALGVLLGWWR
jgi:hypothetical protein